MIYNRLNDFEVRPKQQSMTEILVAHQRQNSSSCLCGWSKLGHSHPEHQADALTAAGFGPVKAEQGPPTHSCPERLMDGRNEIRCWLPAGHEGAHK
jgi:hypothetical protein